jgi:hypothetical protein
MEGQIILNGLSTDHLIELIGDVISDKVEAAIRKAKTEDIQEKFLSVEETRKLFVPNLSRQTISNWSQSGILRKHTISGKVYYRYSEVMEAVKSRKRYSRSNLLTNPKNPT